MRGGPRDDCAAFNVFEHGPGTSVCGDAAVEQVGNTGMIEPREDVALGVESFDLRHGFASQEFECGALVERAVVAQHFVDLAHATAPERAHDAPNPEAVARGERRLHGDRVVVDLWRSLKKTRRRSVRAQQCEQFVMQCLSVGATLGGELFARRRGQIAGTRK